MKTFWNDGIIFVIDFLYPSLKFVLGAERCNKYIFLSLAMLHILFIRQQPPRTALALERNNSLKKELCGELSLKICAG